MKYVDEYLKFQPDLDFMEAFTKAQNVATASKVDANANVSNKNIATMAPEIHKPANIGANRLKMQQRIKELFGEDLAEEYLRQLHNHEIYRHDEAGCPIGTPYCASITLYPFLFDGLTKLGGTTTAPKHLKSFCGGFINLVFAVSAQLCGAVATPEFLAYFDYFCRKDYGNDYYLHPEQVVEHFSGHDKTLDEVIIEYFAQVVYSINQPAAARGSQSVFQNISYFDKPYFTQLFDGFIFPDGDTMHQESVSQLQKRFMSQFNAERLKNILTFPVETISLLNDDENFVDSEWADFTADMYSRGHSFFTYTSDSVDSLASCCFAPTTTVLIKNTDGDTFRMPLKEVYRSYHDKQIYTTYGGHQVPVTVMRAPGRLMYAIYLRGEPDPIECTDNHIQPTQRGDVPTCDLHKGDYLLYDRLHVPERNLYDFTSNITHLLDKNEMIYIEKVEPQKYNSYEQVYCLTRNEDELPYFTLPNGIITHNCRLRNGIQDNQFSYTLGAGGVSTGSKCVMTININRLVQNTVKNRDEDEDVYLPKLRTAVQEQIDKLHKYLYAFNTIVKDMEAAHMITIYDAGFVSPERQYLTAGVNGLPEGAEYLHIPITDNARYQHYVQAILGTIKDSNAAAKTKEIMYNTELVPAENLGVKNAKQDRRDGYWVPRDCYNSYFYLVEDPKTNVIDKFNLQGSKYTSCLDGGAALHCNLDEHLSKQQYKFLLKYAIKSGCYYFTFNIPNTICNKCGYISKHRLQKCPKCGSEDLDYASRVIGYLTRISKQSAERQAEEKRRYYATEEDADWSIVKATPSL